MQSAFGIEETPLHQQSLTQTAADGELPHPVLEVSGVIFLSWHTNFMSAHLKAVCRSLEQGMDS